MNGRDDRISDIMYKCLMPFSMNYERYVCVFVGFSITCVYDIFSLVLSFYLLLMLDVVDEYLKKLYDPSRGIEF